MSRRPSRLRLQVETLEDRYLPASTAAVNAGLLTISGDPATASESIDITQTTLPGTYQVTVRDAGISAICQTFSNITDIQLLAGTGKDTISLGGNTSSGTGLTGNLTISGAGQLTVNLGSSASGFIVAGRVAITDTSPTQALAVTAMNPATTLGSLAVTDGDGGSSIAVQDGVLVNGPAGFFFGNGIDSVVLGGGAAGDPGVQVTGSLIYNGGGGNNSLSILDSSTGGLSIGSANNITLDHATVGGELLTTFTGQATITLQNQTVVKGFVSLNGSTTSAITVNVTNSTINSFFSVTSGVFGGGDAIHMTGSAVGGNVGMELGAGTDTLVLTGTSVAGSLVTSGAGSLVVNLENGSGIAGFVSFNETGGLSSDTITVTNSNVGRFFSVVTGPHSADSITFQGATIGSNLGVGLGSGTDTLTVNQTAMGGSLVLAGQGSVLFTLQNGSNVGSFLNLNESASLSTDTVTVNNSTVGGFFSATGGSGSSDSITINGASVGGAFGLGLGSGTSSLSLANLTVNGNFMVQTAGATAFTAAGPSVVGSNQVLALTPANASALLNALLGAAASGGNTTTTSPPPLTPPPIPGSNVMNTIFGPGQPTGVPNSTGLTHLNDLGAFFATVF